jgi:glycogen debranching enzyme
MIPQKMAPGQASDISGPCMLGWAAWQIYQWDKMRDRDFLQRSFDTVQKHVTWCLKNRRLDGEPPPTQPLEYGTPLYGWKSAEESGAENSPRFEGGAAFAAIDLSCYLVNECRSLQAMAQALGYGELAKTWGRRAEAIAEAARRELWDAQRGFFFDRKGPGGQWIDVWTSAGLLPLWAGVATADQAQRLRDHLADPRKFWTAMPVPSVARDDPKFKKDMWSGPTWVTMNYLLVRGLQRYGFAREAAELREKTLSSVVAWYGRTGALYEFYDCDGQTPPPELDRKGRLAAHQGTPVISDYNATAALYADLLIRPEP